MLRSAQHEVGMGWPLLFQYRELVENLVMRDLKARYKRSVLGFLWCLLNPLLMMAVFTLLFAVLMPNQIPAFPVFVLVGVLAWNLHSTALLGATHSVVSHAPLVQKVAFPREVLPLAAVLSNTVNFLLALIVLFALIILSGVQLSFSV